MPFILCHISFVIAGCSRDEFHDVRDVNLPGGNKVISTSSDDIEIANFNDGFKPLVPEEVVGAGWNTNFIVAKQQLFKNRGAFPGDTFRIPDPGKFKYWIIDIKTSNTIGPMTEVEYQRELNSLGQGPVKIQRIEDLKS
jgi:hypothetical protein